MSQRQIIRHTIADAAGRRLPMTILPADDPKNSPMLVVFHGWTGGMNVARDFDTMITPAHVHEFPRNWTIVLPQDRYGFARCGCWWLGENNDFFMPDLLDAMVRTIGQSVGCNGSIYTFGISMGGFAALLYGFRWKARGICANVPQVRLLGTEYAQGRCVRYVFGGADNVAAMEKPLDGMDPALAARARLADATCFLDPALPADRKATVLINQSRFDISRDYVKEHCLYLVDRLTACGYNYDLRIHPEHGHGKYVNTLAALTWFEQNKALIEGGLDPDYSEEAENNDPAVMAARRLLDDWEAEHVRK